MISTKEEGYVRNPAPKWQLLLSNLVYKDKQITDDLRNRHIRYKEQWDKIAELEKQGKALVLRPHKDLGVTRYTTDPEKLGPWFQLGYDETLWIKSKNSLNKKPGFPGFSFATTII